MTLHHGQCTCGQLSITCSGDPVRVSVCHCLACQRRTGSPFGQQARWPKEQVTIAGDATTYVRIGDSGGEITYAFCPRCGSTVYYAIDGMPGVVAVPVGAFADPSFSPPSFSVYEARRHAWVKLPDGIEHMD